MPKTSAGILPYRSRGGRLEVLLVHPGTLLGEEGPRVLVDSKGRV